MEVVYPRCCRIDVHQSSPAICVSIKERRRTEKHRLSCGTNTAELLRSPTGYIRISSPTWRWRQEIRNSFAVLQLCFPSSQSPNLQRIATWSIPGQFCPAAAHPAVAGFDTEPDHTQAGTGPHWQSHPEGAGRREHQTGQA